MSDGTERYFIVASVLANNLSKLDKIVKSTKSQFKHKKEYKFYRSSDKSKIYFIKHFDSNVNSYLAVVDFIAGIYYQKYNFKKSQYFKILNDSDLKIKVVKVPWERIKRELIDRRKRPSK